MDIYIYILIFLHECVNWILYHEILPRIEVDAGNEAIAVTMQLASSLEYLLKKLLKR